MHHPKLHSVFVKEAPLLKSSSNSLDTNCILLMLSTVRSRFRDLYVFFDPLSNLTIITHDTARKLGLKGTDVFMSLTKVGNVTERIESKVYTVSLIYELRKEWMVEAVGLNELTSEFTKVDMTEMGVDA